MKSLLWLSVLLFAATIVVAKSCEKEIPDGCTLPRWLSLPWKGTFTPACKKHDMCYFCGKPTHPRHKLTRYQCDKAFLRDMKKACNKRGWLSGRVECKFWANVYYGGVRAFGNKYWKKYCETSCNLS